MTKHELELKIAECDMELRSLTNEVKNNADVNLEEAKAKMDDIEKRRADFTKQIAQMDAPQPTAEKRMFCGMDVEEIRSSLKQNRTVTLSGTGVVNTVRDIVLAAQKDDAILSKISINFGAAAKEIIPIFANNVAFSFVTEGGDFAESNSNLGTSEVVPHECGASLKVSDYVLDLPPALFEAKLQEIFTNGLRDLMRAQVLTGAPASTGTHVNDCQGIFTDTGITVETHQLTVADLGEFAMTLNGKKFKNRSIVMSSTVYKAFTSDTATDETTKIYKEDLIKNKKIEGVDVIVTPDAPTSVATNAIACVGGDLANYGMGVAGQLTIKGKEVAGKAYKVFDASAYFNGKPVISADFYGFKVAAATTQAAASGGSNG